MWEVFTEGRMPFEQNQNHEVVTLVTKGHRLYRPKQAPPTIYDIMQICWREVSAMTLALWLLNAKLRLPATVLANGLMLTSSRQKHIVPVRLTACVSVSEAGGASILLQALPADLWLLGRWHPSSKLTNQLPASFMPPVVGMLAPNPPFSRVLSQHKRAGFNDTLRVWNWMTSPLIDQSHLFIQSSHERVHLTAMNSWTDSCETEAAFKNKLLLF